MTELTRQIRERIEHATERLKAATASEDDYLIEVTLGEIESLRRTAEDNGLTIPEAEDVFAAR